MIKVDNGGRVKAEGNLVNLIFEWVLISHVLHDLIAKDLGYGEADEMMLDTLLTMLSGKFDLKCEDGEDDDWDNEDYDFDDDDWEGLLE